MAQAYALDLPNLPSPRRRTWALDALTRLSRDRLQRALLQAGVQLDGNNPWDPQVRHPSAYLRCAMGSSLGIAESYIEGGWDCDALDELVARLVRSGSAYGRGAGWSGLRDRVLSTLVNRQSLGRARANVMAHYDLGNPLYEAMLGPSMTYSCGYWRTAKTLEEAQQAKLELIGKKLGLRRGHRVLDIGCGWGSFARYAAEQGARVVGITVSPAQADYARELCRGLPVEIRTEDYRQIDERFDRIVSVGMFEHVGPKNYATYMRHAHRCLSEDGLFLLHTIGTLDSTGHADPFIDRYIFPAAILPSVSQIVTAAEGLFVVEDLHNFGADYDPTLRAWWRNVEAAWPRLRERYDERFQRIWRYYLLGCAGAFRARHTQVWQLVLSKHGVYGGYVRPGS